MKLTTGKIALLGSGMDKLTVKRLESVEDDYSNPTTDSPIKGWNFMLRSYVIRLPRVSTSPYLLIHKFWSR